MISCLSAAILCGGARPAAAQPTPEDAALATTLFQDGRALMAGGRIAEACPKLEESQRLDPGGGTLLNLALCHEQAGRLARSWSEFNDAAAVARRDGRRDRELAADSHAAALWPRLSKLTVVVPPLSMVQGLRVDWDGREMDRAAWSTAIPVDGGEHVVRATAPGRRPFTKTVVVADASDAQTVEVPVLEAALPVAVEDRPRQSSPPAAIPGSPVAVVGRPTESPPPRNLARILGWTFGGAGLVQMGLAGYFGWRAFDLHCTNGCGTENDAGRAADVSTILTITGVATLGTGLVLLLVSRNRGSETAAPPTLTVQVTNRGFRLGGRF